MHESYATHSAAAEARWTILCDFDATISLEDVTDALLLRFARPGWEALETAWREGRIGSRDCMAGQVALLDCSRAELDDCLATMAIDPDFATFAAAAREAGMALEIVSDGLDYACQTILRRHGLESLPLRANRLVQSGARQWRLEFPYSDPGCRSASGTCKCARMAADKSRGSRVLVIGDGMSDVCMAQQAALVFAKERLLEHCLGQGLPYVPVASFAQALALLPRLGALAARAANDEAQWAI
jgi:2,3-diketo-5-methylthio-1-phosphopentane phosphatase